MSNISNQLSTFAANLDDAEQASFLPPTVEGHPLTDNPCGMPQEDADVRHHVGRIAKQRQEHVDRSQLGAVPEASGETTNSNVSHRNQGSAEAALEASPTGAGDSPTKTYQFLHDFPLYIGKAYDAPFWKLYVDEASGYDTRMVEAWDKTMDVLLVFAALFSAVVTAFLIMSYTMLQPDSGQSTVDGLVAISQQLAVLTSGGSQLTAGISAFEPEPFIVSTGAVYVNGLWFVSLMLSLIVSVVDMLVKQWIHSYSSNLSIVPETRARQRHYRYMGLIAWQMHSIINALPLLLHISVFLFSAGLVAFLWTIHGGLATLICCLSGSALLVYVFSAAIPVFVPNCPYKSPLTSAFLIILKSASTLVGRVTAYIKHQRRWASSPLQSMQIGVRSIKPLMKSMVSACARLSAVPFGLIHWNKCLFRFRTEAVVIASQATKIDLHTVAWLESVTSDPKLIEGVLFCLVGWNATYSRDHSEALPSQPHIAVAASEAIHKRLRQHLGQYDGILTTAVESELPELASLCPLVWDLGLQMRDEQWQAFEVIASQSTEGDTPLLACAFIIYGRGIGKAQFGGGVGSSGWVQRTYALKWLDHAADQLVQAVQLQQIPVFGCCLLLHRLAHSLQYGGISRSWAKIDDLVSALSSLIRHAPVIPAPFLSCAFSFFMALSPPNKDLLETSLEFDWNKSHVTLILDHLQDASADTRTLHAAMDFVAHQPSHFDSVNERVVLAVCSWLKSNMLAANPLSTSTSGASPPVSAQDLAHTAFDTIQTLVRRGSRRCSLSTRITIAHLQVIPIDSDLHADIEQYWPDTHDTEQAFEAVQSRALHQLVEQICRSPSIIDTQLVELTMHVVSTACMYGDEHIINMVLESNWLIMLVNIGLPHIFQNLMTQPTVGAHTSLQLAAGCLWLLAQLHEATVVESGVLQQLHELREQSNIRGFWDTIVLHDFDKLNNPMNHIPGKKITWRGRQLWPFQHRKHVPLFDAVVAREKSENAGVEGMPVTWSSRLRQTLSKVGLMHSPHAHVTPGNSVATTGIHLSAFGETILPRKPENITGVTV